MKQGPGQGIRGPSTVPQGGSIVVDVGSADTSVQLGSAEGGLLGSYPVGGSRRVVIPVPAVPGGSLLWVRAGRGVDAKVILIEVVETLTAPEHP